jgi:hypothetical protein
MITKICKIENEDDEEPLGRRLYVFFLEMLTQRPPLADLLSSFCHTGDSDNAKLDTFGGC